MRAKNVQKEITCKTLLMGLSKHSWRFSKWTNNVITSHCVAKLGETGNSVEEAELLDI